MGLRERIGSARSILWACGYSLIVSQWLSNGSLGSSWLPKLSDLGVVFVIGQVSLWASYLVFLAVLALAGKRGISPLYERKWLLACGISGIIIGNFLVYMTGSGRLASGFYILGMLLVGSGNSVLMLGWGEYYCAIGEKRSCLTLSLSFIIGSILFQIISTIGQYSILGAMIVQLALLPFCPVMLVRSCRALENPDLFKDTKNEGFSYKTLLPLYLTVLVFGFVLGIITGLTSVQEVQTSPFVWALGMIAMGSLLLVSTLFIGEFTLDRLSSILMPMLATSMLLIPAFIHSYFDIVSVFVCAGYIYARVFYIIAYVSIAQTRTVPALQLVASVIAVDTIGIITGQILCGIALRDSLSIDTTYLIVAIAIALLIVTGSFSLREKNILSLWGLKQEVDGGASIEKKCMKAALEYNLTLRETEIATRLAQGITAEIIASELDISVATTRTHMRNIYAKTGVHSQPELIRLIVFTELD